MRAIVVYESMYGNTERIAQAVAEGLSTRLPVETVEVSAAPRDLPEATLLVVGGPTHAFGMSRARTRQDAAVRATAPIVSPGTGVREWLEQLTITGHPLVATFDTKVARPHLPGSAAHAISRGLHRKGCQVLQPPETFLVDGMSGPLVNGELDRARTFGERLGAKTDTTTRPPPLPRTRSARRSQRHTIVAVITGLMTVSALAGAVGLGRGAGDFFGARTATIYDRLPFDSPGFAAAALVLIVGLPMALTTVLAWRGSRHAAAVGAATGTLLVGWITVQLAFIGAFYWLQPVCVTVGLAVLYLSLTLERPTIADARIPPAVGPRDGPAFNLCPHAPAAARSMTSDTALTESDPT